MTTATIVLVPGFWLGAWAWDGVAPLLRAEGHRVKPLTLPGLESRDADRSRITLDDHVAAISEAVRHADPPVVLVVHSGAGCSGYVASDRVADRIAAMVYVDTGPSSGPIDARFEGVERPLPSLEQLGVENNVDGLSGEQLTTLQRRAVPEPGGVIRGVPTFTDDRRLDIPTTVVCCGFNALWLERLGLVGRSPSEQIKALLAQGYAWLGGLHDLRNVTWVDLPTGHWPMWSRPRDLARIILDVTRAVAGA